MSIVAIVGRPNVGKSTLFNKIVGRRQALVSDLPGVTRDRHYAEADWVGHEFTLIDTGGLSFAEGDDLESKVHKQSIAALVQASVIICIFDGRAGLTPLDKEIVNIFRKGDKKIIYAVNKIDTESREDLIYDFSQLGIDVIPVSAEHNINIDELLDKVVEQMGGRSHSNEGDVSEPDTDKDRPIKISLVGRPNVGKSTIINFLANEERVVAHELPGTTRDTIDVEVKFKDRDYIFVDTAGIKKRAKTTQKIDKFSTMKSLRAIDDADVVFVVLDSEEGFVRQDLTLAAHSFGLYKPTAILANKWDKVDIEKREFLTTLRFQLKDLRDLPILCLSGLTGYKCNQIFSVADKLISDSNKRVKTSSLNRFFSDLIEHHPPPDYQGKSIKLNYITQADINPPVFIVFTNNPKGIPRTYKQYIKKGLDKLLGGLKIPLVLKFKSK